MLDLETASVANLKLGKRKRAETAIAVEAECIFQMSASVVGGTAFVVGDGNFFPRIDVADRMYGFNFCISVPIIVCIWETAMVDETNGRINAANRRVGTAGQSVRFDNAAERVLITEIVVKGKELSLLVL